MQRFAPALIALLAAVALVTAAGSFDAVDGPSVSGDSTPGESVQRQQGGSAPPTPSREGARGSYDGDDQTTAASGSGGGGVSALLVAALLGTLVVGGVLVVFLTDDDARAPAGGGEPGDDRDPPTPAVSPDYESPPDSAVVRAWRTLADRADADETATPGETARAARDRGLPRDPVDRVTRHFEAVRYGRAAADERESAVQRVRDALAADDRGGADAGGGADDAAGGAGERP